MYENKDIYIAELLSNSDILLLQKTWLLKSQIGTINQYFSEFNTCGISAMNENVLNGLKAISQNALSMLNFKPLNQTPNQ